MPLHQRDQLLQLLPQLAALPSETGWVEFKMGNVDPEIIGKNLSALANGACLASEPFGYMIWGIRDSDHEIVGTDADPARKKVGNEEVHLWLSRMISPDTHFEFNILKIGSIRVVILAVQAASFEPVKFKHQAYTRVGSNSTPLSKHPDHERRLWRAFDQQPAEIATAKDRLSTEQVLSLLDYAAYFEMLGLQTPFDPNEVLNAFATKELVSKMPGTGWRITTLGAILLAKRLSDFPTLERKALRVIHYQGKDRTASAREQVGQRGYAPGFAGLIEYINALLPINEQIGEALRVSTPLYPEIAVRELVANALIHQDLSVRGAGPMIEVFEDRVEISNPGAPLVPVDRLLDAPPQSRNEKLASILRQMGVCEERGSGWDKVAFQVEFAQLPAPDVDASSGSTRVTLFSPRSLVQMTSEDRVRAVYLHACLRHITQEHTTNSSIRARFSIGEKNKALASRLLSEAISKEMIKPYDPGAGPRSIRYVPFWAATYDNAPKFVDR